MKTRTEKIYSIPPGTKFWSIAIQETVSSERELYVRETHYDAFSKKPIFGILQLKFDNLALQWYFGESAISYIDKHNGDIGIDFSECRLIRKTKIKETNYGLEIDNRNNKRKSH